MRFAMVAKTLVRERAAGEGEGGGGIRDITARNVAKVTRFREGGEEELEKTVRRLETMAGLGEGEAKENGEGEAKEMEKEKGEGEGEGKEGQERQERQPWEPFARMRQRQRDKAESERPLTAWEKRDIRRPRRDPNTGRREERRKRIY